MKHMVRRIICLATVAGLSFGASAKSSADSYANSDNSLIAQWDGIDNLADGTHHDNATVWKDRISGYEFSLSNVTVGDRYLGFSGSASYGQLVTGASAAFPSGAKTVEIVIKLDSTGDGIALHGPTDSGVSFGPYQGNILINNKQNGVGYSKPGTGVTNVYATVYGADSMPSGFNLNGASCSSTGANNYWGSPDASAWLGRRSNGTYLACKIFAIRVYNRALTADEIAYNYSVDQLRFFSDEGLKIKPIPDQAFTGAAIVPEVQVSYQRGGDTIPLSKGEDYTVTCTDNVGIGTVRMTITGINAYADSDPFSTTFNIVPPPADERIRLEGTFEPKAVTFGSAAKIRDLRVLGADGQPLADGTYEVNYLNNTATGTATVWARGTSGTAEGALAAAAFDVKVLPEGYVPLEWIASAGDQLIDTGYVPTTAKTGVDIRFGQVKNAGNQAIFAQSWAWGNGFLLQANPAFRFENNKAIDGYAEGRDYHLTILPGGTVTMDYGEGPVTTTGFGNGTRANTHLGLFASGDNGNYRATFRLYACTITDAGTPVRDFVPALRVDDWKPGLVNVLDTDASTCFYANARTGKDFEMGPMATDFVVESSSLPPQRPDGTEKRPVPVIIDKATGEVVPAENFTYSYANNVESGTARVTATGVAGTPVEGVTVYATFIISRLIFATFEGAGTQDGTSWENAMAPQAALTAAQTEYDAGGLAQVFFKAGTYPLTAALTLNKPAYVYGGCLGASGTSLELAGDDAETTFDGQGTATKASSLEQAVTVSSVAAGKLNLFERCGFGHFKTHGFVKTGAADIRFRKCRFFDNGWGVQTEISGRGFSLTGAADTEAFFEDCEVIGNGDNNAAGYQYYGGGDGFGGYLKTFKRVTFDRTSFVTNAWGGDGYRWAQGAAISANASPLTVRNCQFVGHRLGHPTMGATVLLNDGCGGSAFTNCLFLGNATRHDNTYGMGQNSGCIHAHFGTAEQTLDVDHCTFAYNLQGAALSGYNGGQYCGSAAALDVLRGTVKVRNSIFWGNSISSDNSAGADIFIRGGTLDVDYSLFGGLTTDYIRAYGGALITFGEHLVTGDPNFVTRPETVAAAFSSQKDFAFPRSTATAKNMYYTSRALVASFDAHVVSDAAKYSPAIDGSDPSEGVVNEPTPNGGIANLGCYGNTSEAALTIAGAQTLADTDVQIAFPNGFSLPEVTFTTGAADELQSNARVTVFAGTDPGDYELRMDFAGVRAGDSRTAAFEKAFAASETLYVKVVVSVPGQSDVIVTKTATVEGAEPEWYGHGGDALRVVHVRAGSTARDPKGTSWADAYPSIEAANGALGEVRNEMWVAGRFELAKTPTDFTLSYPATIRGGFTGTEDSADERAEGTVSTLSGGLTCTPFVTLLANALTIERMRFEYGRPRAIYRRAGVGDLTVEDCEFICNGATDATAVAGGAIYSEFISGKYASAALTVSRCRFEGNGRTIKSNAQLDGACIYANTAKSLTVSDCTFLTNGAPFSLVVNDTSSVRPVGTCVYASATPTVIERCRFAGNRTCCYKTDQVGGLIYFTGTCDDSVVRNCAFVGNECVTRTNAKNDGGSIGGMIVANLGEAIRSVYVENCTFAWDFASGLSVPADICAHKGVINVKNSIFFGGQVGDQTAAGTGRYLNANANGTVNVAYSMFDVAFTNAAGSVGVNVEATCMTNSPAFVTANLDLPVWRDAAANVFQRYTNEAERVAISGDVHLLSPAGYWDNAGGYHEDADRVSPAIDAGDPADDCSNEPTPNGGFINLGAYGNTANASKTVVVKPEIVDEKIDVTFPDNTSLPNVAFDLKASSVDYTAVATVYCGAEDGVWDATSPSLPIRGGERFSWQCLSAPYPAGSTVFVKVVITSGDYVIEKTVSATASGEMPKWYGKGGGARVLHVWADAPGAGTGASWRDAFRTFDEAIDAFDPSAHDEIWVCGDYTLGKTGSFSPTAAFAVRGGFDACEDVPEERAAGTISHVDGFNSYNAFVLANGADAPVTIDRISVDNCYDRGIKKTGAGDLTVMDCQILTNGVHGTYNDGAGKGILVTSAAGANVVVMRTLFSGNRLNDASTNQTTGQGSGSGINMSSGASLTVTDCQFYCNGHPLEAPSTSHSGNPRCGGIAGSAIYSTVPTTVSFSRFCGNTCICDGTAGGVIALRGAAAGSRVEHCVFAGNMDMNNGSNNPGGDSVTGGVAIMLDDAAGTVEIVNDTFAYNISAGKTAAAGLTVKKGVANVRNCVFWGNRIQASGVTDVARDINVRETGTCNVSYSILSADDATSYTKAIGGVLNDDSWVGMSFGDPLLISPESCVTDYLKNISGSHIQWDSAKKPDYALWTIDVHEKSCGGYFNNAGDELHDVEEGVISMAVDAGSADDLVGDEPDPNGGRINAGAYGGTVQASMSASGAPAVDGDITISFPDGTTRPEIGFTVGGEGTFLATAEIYLSSDGGDTWTLVRTQGGIAKGQFVSYYVPAVYQTTDQLVAKVVLTGGSSGGAVEKTSDVVVPSDKKLPYWYGHGGDSNKVIHVRADAFGDGSGRDWANAVNGFQAAMAMLTAERNEIWLAVSNVNDAASKTYAPDFPIVIRGGFAATEDRIEERADGVRSFIDGRGINNNLVLANAHPVYIERIEFRRGSSRAFCKNGGAGDLEMVDCGFSGGCWGENANGTGGSGGCFVGDSARTAKLTLTRCDFRGNYYGTDGYGYMNGAAYFGNFATATLDSCLFVTNGTRGFASNNQGNSGAAVFGAKNVKMLLSGCEFRGNYASSAGQGGHVCLYGGCDGSEFRNCVFVGNLEKRVTYNATISNGGCIYVNGNFQERMRVLVENCTFAYNLVGSGAFTPVAIQVNRGAVTVKNCIFHANALAANNAAPVDIYVRKDADDPEGTSCTVTYSMFDGLTSDYYGAAAEGLLSVDTATCREGDPLFVSTTNDFFTLVNCGSGAPTLPRMPVTDTNDKINTHCNLYLKNDAASLAKILAFNVHLRGGSGYVDETTGETVKDWARKRYGNSPAIDAGDPASDYSCEPTPNGRHVNMGAYGNTPWATMSKGGTMLLVK